MNEDPRDAETAPVETEAVAPESVPESDPVSEPIPDSEPIATVPAYQRYDCTRPDDAVSVKRAAEAARIAVSRGECVVIPTDTVYGIGADAFDADAVQRLLDAKGRGRDMPPPVLIADARLLKALATNVPQVAKDLVEACWPGPLTIVCKAQDSLRMDLGETEGTIALRVPDHELARELLRRTGPMAVSSANLSGKPAALTCDEAVAMLGDSVSVYLDGGTVGEGVDIANASSTMIDFASTEHGRVLRAGALSLDVVRGYCPDLIVPGSSEEAAEPVVAVVPARLRHTLQPPLAQSPYDEWLAEEGLASSEDVEDRIDEAAADVPEPESAREEGEWRVDDDEQPFHDEPTDEPTDKRTDEAAGWPPKRGN